MKVLGIDTASALCAAAIVEDAAVIVERHIPIPHAHSEKLLPLIGDCLRSVNLSLNDMDGIAISIGPGSFTGLRIGLSVAKGLSLAAGKPLVSVPTLFALSWKAVIEKRGVENGFILPLIDARRDDVYTALYRFQNGLLEEIMPPSVMAAAEASRKMEGKAPLLLLGDGADKFRRHYKKAEILNLSHYIIPSCGASAVAIVGLTALKEKRIEDIALLEPLYLRDLYTPAKN